MSFRGRPASADVGQLNRNPRLKFRSSSDDRINARPQSSSNILRLLLSENINRKGDEGQFSDPPHSSMDERGSQSEEEIPHKKFQTEVREATKNESASKAFLTRFRKSIDNQSQSNSNRKPKDTPTIRSSKPIKFTQEKVEEKPDLPGRVSFSSNDVFEVDYSDFSDDSRFELTEKTQSKKFVHFREETPTERKSPSDMNFSQKSDSSDQIIEEYKKEIENLNRLHVEEIAKLSSEQNDVLFFNNNNLMLPVADSMDSTKKSIVESYLETIKETENGDIPEQIEIEPFTEDEELPAELEIDLSRDSRQMSLQMTSTTTWDNAQKEDVLKDLSSSSDEKIETIPEPPEKKEPVIKQPPKRPVQPKISQPMTKNILRKPKTPQHPRLNVGKAPTLQQPDPRLRKSKSVSNLKEEEHLRDFQMDKVDSWMSIHSKEKEMDSMRSLMLMKRPQSSHTHLGYNKDWRDTPSSKTDDEGNFSLEEANDCYSNESTTYDELVSIIKEIEADKKKTTERKNLQTDVEFKLQSEDTNVEVKDPVSDPVK